MVSKYEYIDSQHAEPGNTDPVLKMTRWLQVSTSGFYNWRSRPQSATAARRDVLAVKIHAFFTASKGRYGYRRIHADLAAEGTQCSPELVRQIMGRENLVPCQPRPYRVTTQSDPDADDAIKDLVNRDFTADRPGVKFVGDITYLHTWQGFIYLATVIDCYSKKVIAHAMDDHYRTSLITTAIRRAAATGLADQAIFHTDRGEQLHLARVPHSPGRPRTAPFDRQDRGLLR